MESLPPSQENTNNYPLWFRSATAIFLFFLICGISIWGYLISGHGINDALYTTIQLMVLEGDFDDWDKGIPWQLELARFGLPLFPTAALLVILYQLAGNQLILIRLLFFPRSAVFFGDEPIARVIASNLPEKKQLHIRLGHQALRRPVDHGHRYLAIDTENAHLSSKWLARLHLHHADNLYLFTGEETTNVELARAIITVITRRTKKVPRLIVGITSKSLRYAVDQDTAFTDYRTNKGGDIVWYDADAQASRMLMLRYPPIDYLSKRLIKPVHIALVGFNDFAKTLSLQIARHCVYLDERPVCISVFAPNRQAFEDFLATHPILTNMQLSNSLLSLRQFSLHQCHPDAITPRHINEALQGMNAGSFDKVYLCGDDDYSALHTSMRLRQALIVAGQSCEPICCIPGTHFNSASVLSTFCASRPEQYANMKMFHAIDDVIHPNEIYPGYTADILGIVVNGVYSYLASHNNETDTDGTLPTSIHIDPQAALLAWQNIRYEFARWSSRHSGDHIFAKLRELGFNLRLKSDETNNSDAQQIVGELSLAIEANLDALNRLEHHRYCAERLVDGWLPHTTTIRHLCLNETLIPYDQLTDSDKHKDEAIIRVLPMLFSCPQIAKTYRLEKLLPNEQPTNSI